jgi:hypothetical protein
MPRDTSHLERLRTRATRSRLANGGTADGSGGRYGSHAGQCRQRVKIDAIGRTLTHVRGVGRGIIPAAIGRGRGARRRWGGNYGDDRHGWPCKDHTETLDAIDRATKGQQGKRTDLVDISNEVDRPTGTTKAAALRRLRKDRPDLHPAPLAGCFWFLVLPNARPCYRIRDFLQKVAPR